MDKTRLLIHFLDDLKNPRPDELDFATYDIDGRGELHPALYDEAAFEAATEAWEEDAQARHADIDRWLDHSYDQEHSAQRESMILRLLRTAAQDITEAETRRDQLLALAVESGGLSIRQASEAAGLHHATASKRISDPLHHPLIIEFKRRELAALEEAVATTARPAAPEAHEPLA